MKTKRREDDRLPKMLAKVPRHPSRMKWVLSEIKEKKVVIGNERWSGLCFNPL